jgi:hypothetical protein
MKRPALNLADPTAVRVWLDDLAARVDDVASVAADQTAPVADRKLGRAAARELLRDARGTLADLVALARAGLPTDPDASPASPAADVTLDPENPPWVTSGERAPWGAPETRRHLPPVERARQALHTYLDMALPNGARGKYGAEIRRIVDDIINATITRLRQEDHGDPAGLGGAGPVA